MKRWWLYISVFSLPNVMFAQNLDKIGQEGMATVSGGLNYNMVGNSTRGSEQFRDPFAWTLSGNLTVTLLDLSLPFTFSFSNAGNSYTQPFTMTAVHPKYKDWTAHLGITSMSFSQYTYQGLNFAGAGLEYAPKKWHIKVFGGRLKKAIEYDAEVDNINTVSYRRFGFGLSTKYTGSIFGTELILFKAYDDGKSLSYLPQNPELTVRDNFVASLIGNVRLFKNLQLKGELASSLLTRDVLAKNLTESSRFYDGLVRGNETTVTKQAYAMSADYRYKIAGIGIKYERIDPEYATLGAVYFNNDLENITVNPSVTLFKSKLNIAISTGYQRNNLDNKNSTHNKRWIGSINLSAQPIKNGSVGLNYSNQSSFTKRNPSADPFYTPIGDTLNYYQVSQNVSSSLSYGFGDSVKQAVSLTFAYTQSENITGRLEDAGAFGFNVSSDTSSLPVDVYNGVLMHQISLAKSGTGFGWTLNGNYAQAMGVSNTFFGPGLTFSQSFKPQKIELTAGATHNLQFTESLLANNVFNYRLGLRYAPEWWEKEYGTLNFSLNGTFTQRIAVLNHPNTSNLTLIANLSYQL